MTWTAPHFDGGPGLRACAAPERWAAAAREAAARHGLSCGEPRMFPTGSDVVLDCGSLVFKMTAPRWAAEIAAEASLLERVAGRLPVATPEPLGTGELDGWPYVLMSRLPGRALAELWPSLAPAERRRLAADLGGLLAALHALPVAEDEAAAWPDFHERMRRGAAARLAGADRTAATHVEAWLDRVEPFLASLPEPSARPPCLLHTEVYDQHVLVEERAGRWELAALIDFADGRAGHPWYELPALVEFVFHGERPLLRELLLAYGLPAAELDEELSLELCGFGLTHQFNHLKRLLTAAGPPEPSGFEELGLRLYGFD